MAKRAASSGYQSDRAGIPLTYRGSRKRIRRIGLRGNWSLEIAILLIVLLLALLVVLPWLIRHPPVHH